MTLSAEEIINKLKNSIGDKLISSSIRERSEGFLNKTLQLHIYLKVDREYFHKTVSILNEITPLHAACPMAAKQDANNIELVYSFSIYFAQEKFAEMPVIISVTLPKNDPRIRTLTDILPGMLVMEMEAQEMLGIQVEDIPDKRRFFTPSYLEKSYYPHKKNFEESKSEVPS